MKKDYSNLKALLIDLDGTVYLGNTVFDYSKQALDKLRTKYKICFLTNNSSKSNSSYFGKLKGMNLCNNINEIYSSANAMSEYLLNNYAKSNIFVLGTPSLQEQFIIDGLNVVKDSTQADCVVLGYDTTLTYENLCKACLAIRNGAVYLATHDDLNCPSEAGDIPDCGSLIALIEKSTNRLPQIITGKPYLPMAKAIASKMGIELNQMAMIGDRLYTDIAFGINNNFASFLVMSGETNVEMLQKSSIQPTEVFDNIWEIANKLV